MSLALFGACAEEPTRAPVAPAAVTAPTEAPPPVPTEDTLTREAELPYGIGEPIPEVWRTPRLGPANE